MSPKNRKMPEWLKSTGPRGRGMKWSWREEQRPDTKGITAAVNSVWFILSVKREATEGL